jgi:exodeoxyribonuclease-3
MVAMRIATWNVNHVRNRLPLLLAWLDATRPDVVALQELKCTEAAFPFEALAAAGYAAVVVGQRTWNGVALLVRGDAPIVVRRRLPGDPDDHEARYLEVAVQGVLVASLYLPNGNPWPGPKFDAKMRWFERLRVHAQGLLAARAPVVLAGDFNVVPTDADIYATRSFADNALLQPEPRAAFAGMLADGWTDAVRTLHPDAPMYSFWSFLRNRWARDAGLRIDHLLLSPPAAQRLRAAGVDRAVRGMEDTSDHAPVWIELKKAR